MARVYRLTLTMAILLAALLQGCSNHAENGEHESEGKGESRGEHSGGEHGSARRGEHDREGEGGHGEEGEGGHGEEGEESGTEYTLTEKYDSIRNGVRLVLGYEASTNTFKGTVENTTDKVLERVRVEVHLSNRKELGPTTATDLEPGQKKDVELTATSRDFDRWTAHPEVGSGEHGGGEGGDEHGRESREEHRDE